MQLLVGDLLADAARARPEAIAASLDDRSVTYGETDRAANRIGNGLRGLGVGKGDVVLWVSTPDLLSPAGFAGAARIGAVFASASPSLSEAEFAAVVDYLEPRLVVLGGEGAHRGSPSLCVPPVAYVDDLVASGSASPPDRLVLLDEETHVIYLTSGTTGAPKGVEVSHRASWLRSFPGGSTFAAGLGGDGGILVSFPLFHYGGWHYVLESWHHRCALHLCRRFDGDLMIDAARRWRPSGMYCIPAVWERVLGALDGRSDALASVVRADTGTSAAAPELLQRLKNAMPAASRSVLYGSSEGGHHTTLFERQIAGHPGSVGRAAPPGSIEVSGDGEILYRSPTLMNGYHRLPEQTGAALSGGWYHTGDAGTIDDEGFVYITGRLREVIRSGGESVSPTEVEAALAGLPGIADVAVVGIPDPSWGEVIVAAVVPPAGAESPDLAAIRAQLSGSLASFKHPRLMVEVPSIPRTAATGQVQRTLLRDEILRLTESC